MTTGQLQNYKFYKQEYKRLCDEVPTLPPESECFEVGRKFKERNRYNNVLPNEDTRVKFKKTSIYFNANWMLNGTAIASQGPKGDELKDFFYLLRKRKVDVIVSLANPIEVGKEKCYDYWIGYKPTRLYENGKERILERKIPMYGKEITHFHLKNWPDSRVVEPETLAFLVKKVHEVSDGKILVHCSAGLGRTGTFLACLDAYRKKSKDIFNIAKEIRHPDTGRVGSIQNARQYDIIHRTVNLLLSEFS